MILCDTEIRATLANGQILVLPTPPDEHITTSALDLTLDGGEFKRWKAPQPGIDITVDPSQPGFYRHLSQHFLESVPVETIPSPKILAVGE